MKKLIFLTLLLSITVTNITSAQTKPGKGWLSLFDGKTLNGWRTAQRDTLPEKGWYVQNSELNFDPSIGHGGDIVTTKSFKNFDLSLQFKISEGGNSGIKYFVTIQPVKFIGVP